MSMFDWVHKNKRLIQVVLALITVPFAFFGVDAYFRGGDTANMVAKVGDSGISAREFTVALQERQDFIRQTFGGKIDAAQLDSAELRLDVLQDLIRQRVLLEQAARASLLVPDALLRQTITEAGIFQENGKFSEARYQQILKARGDTPVTFENRVRRDLMISLLTDGFTNTSIASTTVAQRLTALGEQQREVSVALLPAETFLAQVKLEPDAVRKYYDSHASEFRVPEQVRFEYLVLAPEAAGAQASVTPEEVRQYYEQNQAQFQKREERRASHILIAADAKAGAEARAAARAKAEQILKQVRAKPASFADVARRESQDPGSAAKGGDLGYAPRGAMVKSFDDALWALKPGEIGGPVETEYGYHVIRLEAVRGRGFEDVKGQIEADLRRQRSVKRIAEMAELLSNTAFEQGDSLKPAADAVKLPLRQSGWITRAGGGEKPFDNPRLLAAVFSDEVLRDKRNSETVDVGENTLVVARLLEHRPEAVRPFEEVSGEIAKRLTRERAAELAAKEGREQLARVQQGGESALKWSAPQTISRGEAKGLPVPVVAQAFRVDAGKLPAYAGVADGRGGYALVRVTKVIEPETVAPEKSRAVGQQLAQLLAQEELAAAVASFEQKAGVRIDKEKLERRQ